MSGAAYHRSLGSPARRRVLAEVSAAPSPVDAAGVAAALGLHVTTARYHLDRLAEAGLVRRGVDARGGRGRPRALYTAGPPRDDVRDQLIETLSAALGSEIDGPARAREAGRGWGRALADADGADVDGAGDGGDRLVAELERLEFSPEADAGEIVLHSCPFLGAATRHADVVCSAHRGLIDELISPGSARLIPFARPGACVVELG